MIIIMHLVRWDLRPDSLLIRLEIPAAYLPIHSIKHYGRNMRNLALFVTPGLMIPDDDLFFGEFKMTTKVKCGLKSLQKSFRGDVYICNLFESLLNITALLVRLVQTITKCLGIKYRELCFQERIYCYLLAYTTICSTLIIYWLHQLWDFSL